MKQDGEKSDRSYTEKVLLTELAGHSDIETTSRFYCTVDEMHLNAAAKLGDNLLATDYKMTFSAVSEQNQKV
jgi:hypothetical protein